MLFQVEPECLLIEVATGKTLDISQYHEKEPVTIQFHDDPEFGTLGAIFPGDGSLSIHLDGHKIWNDTNPDHRWHG